MRGVGGRIGRRHQERSPDQDREVTQMQAQGSSSQVTPAAVALRGLTVGLVLVTAYIHSTLGGLLFSLNAFGYLVAAVAMVVPLGIAVHYRGVVRLGLIGYALTAIVGWAIMGPRYETAYIAKADELILISVLAIDFLRADGNPVSYVKSVVADGLALVGLRPAKAGASA
jgi:hypothetical protein